MTLGKGPLRSPVASPGGGQGAPLEKRIRDEERGTMTALTVPLKHRVPWRGRARVEEPKAHLFSIRLTKGQRDELDAMADRVE